MKLTRLISILLALVLLTGGAAMGEVSAEARAVISQMIDKFGIPDTYDEFNCNRYGDTWDLTWSSDGEYLSISCDDDGNVYSYYKDSLSFPDVAGLSDVDDEELLAVCDDFLAKCVPAGWEWACNSTRMNAVYDTDRAYVNGYLVYNGLPTDVEFDMSVYLPLREVAYFYRGGEQLINADIIEMSDGDIDSNSAKALLDGALALKLAYVDYSYDSNEPLDLYYKVDTWPGTISVRCDTGALVKASDTWLYENAAGGGEGDGDDLTEKAARPLTEAELSAANIYEGALSAEEVVDLIKAVPSFRLTDDFVVTGCDYYSYSDDIPMCSINLARAVPKDEAEERGVKGTDIRDSVNATVNAVTGDIYSLSIYRPWYRYELSGEINDDDAAETVKYLAGERADSLRLESLDVSDTRRYTFERVYNGITVAGDSAYVELSGEGELISYYLTWDDGAEFVERTEDEIAPYDDAFAVYLKDMRFEKAYLTQYDENAEKYVFVPSYRYVDPTDCYAVDAVTLERLAGYEDGSAFSYEDIDECEHADIITRLASLGIGFDDDRFDPDKALTCEDALTLVLALDGWDTRGRSFDNLLSLWDYNGCDDLTGYEYDSPVTRGDLAKMLVAVAGYSKAAALDGIFLNPFTDEVPDDLLGAAAIAWKLGFISPDDEGSFNAGGTVTRDEAIICAYNYLNAEK